MLTHYLRDRSAKRGAARKHVPKSDAQRIDVRANVDFLFFELLRAGEMRGADEAAHRKRRQIFTRLALV